MALYTFYACNSLESIEIPKNLKEIGSNAFGFCENLKSIVIPEGVNFIGSNAFANCNKVKIYTEIASIPSGWAEDWNPDSREVEWGYVAP